MEKNRILLSQIVTLRGGTIEDVCRYAKSKGITIPDDPDYTLTPSELIAIDPLLAYSLKYEKADLSFTNGTCLSSENIDAEKEGQATDKKPYGNNNSHASKDGKRKEKITKETERVIGIVKFFDSYKGGLRFLATRVSAKNLKMKDDCSVCESPVQSGIHLLHQVMETGSYLRPEKIGDGMPLVQSVWNATENH